MDGAVHLLGLLHNDNVLSLPSADAAGTCVIQAEVVSPPCIVLPLE